MRKQLLLTLTLLLCCLVSQAHDFQVGDFYYNITSTKKLTVGITYFGSDAESTTSTYKGIVEIPETVTWGTTTYTVTSICNYAFWGDTGVTSVTIPNSVTEIDDLAFFGCVELSEISLPNSLINIGPTAFANCAGLTSVNIPNSVTSIESSAFANCVGITSVNIPNSVTCIPPACFSGCSGLKSVTIPNSVTDIGMCSFQYCSNLTAITLPNSVDHIGNAAFYSCPNLSLVNIPNGVSVIGYNAFGNCPKLLNVYCHAENISSTNSGAFNNSPIEFATLYVPTASIESYKETQPWNEFGTIKSIVFEVDGIYYSVLNGEEVEVVARPEDEEKYSGNITIPSEVSYAGVEYKVTAVGYQAFYDCDDLTSLFISESVTSIGERAFQDCDDLTSLYIPESVISIGERAFSSCSGLTEISVDDNNVKYDSREDCNAIIETSSNTLITGCQSTVIPNSITSIGVAAFTNCHNLISLTIPNGVTSIGDAAFKVCINLTSITLPDSLRSIGNQAFMFCNALTSITLPDRLESIGIHAFADENLRDVYCLAKNVPDTHADAFFPLISAATLHVPGSSISKYQSASPWNGFGNIVAISPVSGIFEVDGINYEFNAETKEASVISKNNGKYSGEVVIPELVDLKGTKYNVTSINESAFEGCSSLTSISIPNSVESIGMSAFYGCSGLTSVSIGSGLTNIDYLVFSFCPALTSIKVDQNNSIYDSRDNCNAIIETATNTLVSGCKTTIIPNSVTNIGDSSFSGCYGLTSITIPNSVTNISGSAFANCIDLTSVTISSNVKNIGRWVFYNCTSLTSVTIPNSVVSIDAYAFHSCSGLTSATIPNSVTSIGECAFADCKGLTSVTIPNSVTSIGNLAFAGCPKLLNVYCHAENVSFTDCRAFNHSPIELATLYVPTASIESYKETQPWNGFGTIKSLVFEVDGIYYSVLNGEEVEVVARPEDEEKYSGNITIPSEVSYAGVEYKVTTIGFQAFYGSSVEFVRMPYTLETIDVNAFADCRQLKKVYFPQSIQNIAWNSFVDCPNLEEVDFTHGYSDFKYTLNGLHDGLIEIETKTLVLGCKSGYIDHSVKKIGDGVFSGYILEHIDIPEGVTDIGYAAFYNSDIKSIRIPSTLKRVEQHAFEFRIVSPCRTEIYISDLASWLSIDFNHSEYNPLYWAKKLYLNNVLLEEVVIPNQITKINAHTMAGWSGKKLSIHSNVKSIGELAFYYCENLKEIECHATEPPVCEGESIFSNVDDAILYVPSESLEKYREHNIWGKFKNIKALDFEIKDGTLANFEIADEVEIGSLTYTRTLPNLKWNALYVPFEIPMEEIADKYEVAYINDINSYDKNDDGAIDDMEMEIIKIKSGILNANYPYLIKARNEEARSVSITLEDATLYPTVSTTIDCSSVFAKHEVTGIYDRKYQNELPEGCMAISVNGVWQPIATGSYLNPFRLYMTVSARDGSPVKVEPAALSRIRIRAFDEDMETGIEETENGNLKTENFILDLSGRRVRNPEKGGVYIINGKKVVY